MDEYKQQFTVFKGDADPDVQAERHRAFEEIQAARAGCRTWKEPEPVYVLTVADHLAYIKDIQNGMVDLLSVGDHLAAILEIQDDVRKEGLL